MCYSKRQLKIIRGRNHSNPSFDEIEKLILRYEQGDAKVKIYGKDHPVCIENDEKIVIRELAPNGSVAKQLNCGWILKSKKKVVLDKPEVEIIEIENDDQFVAICGTLPISDKITTYYPDKLRNLKGARIYIRNRNDVLKTIYKYG